jgi:hypothetical protein
VEYGIVLPVALSLDLSDRFHIGARLALSYRPNTSSFAGGVFGGYLLDLGGGLSLDLQARASVRMLKPLNSPSPEVVPPRCGLTLTEVVLDGAAGSRFAHPIAVEQKRDGLMPRHHGTNARATVLRAPQFVVKTKAWTSGRQSLRSPAPLTRGRAEQVQMRGRVSNQCQPTA